ncbi:MAG: hypothetical protein Q7Q73_13945 [Verrucomicrobiota bacterium JB024]|nr:hypothetical protein [Verrucomicrobiota bacterium JB024]
MNKIYSATLLTLLGLCPLLNAVTITFDDASTDLTSNFDYSANPTQYTWQAAGGVDNTGSVSTSTLFNTTAAYTPGTLNFSTIGDSGSISIDFLWTDTLGTGNNYGVMQLGLVKTLGAVLDTRAILMRSGSEVNQVYFRYLTNSGFTNDSDLINLVDSTWYRMEVTFTMTAADTIKAEMTLLNIGSDGTATPVLISSYTAERASDIIGEDVYTGFITQRAYAGSVTTIDNYSTSAIPEPGEGAVFMGALALIVFGGLRKIRARR